MNPPTYSRPFVCTCQYSCLSEPLVFLLAPLRAYLSETAWINEVSKPPPFIPNHKNIMCLHESVITHSNQGTAAKTGEFQSPRCCVGGLFFILVSCVTLKIGVGHKVHLRQLLPLVSLHLSVVRRVGLEHSRHSWVRRTWDDVRAPGPPSGGIEEGTCLH